MELVRRRLAPSRAAAREAIDAGLVTVGGAPALKPATLVAADEDVAVQRPPRRYVSRGGDKLARALEAFGLDPTGWRCLDAGASTGGFTDCLLRAGAAEVLAYDVGYGQIDLRLRQDPRVRVVERTNIRDVTAAAIGEPVDLVVADLSFIALRTVLGVLVDLVRDEGVIVALVKPQFEAGRDDVGARGVVRDPRVWGRVLDEVAATAATLGWGTVDYVVSPLTGASGNVEFLARMTRGPARVRGRDRAVADGEALRSAPSSGDRRPSRSAP